MARSDLLINLVRSKTRGDDRLFQQTVEAIIAEEREKQHHTLANQIATELKENFESKSTIFTSNTSKLQNLIFETQPQKRINDLVLSEGVLKVCEEVIEEHHRVELLRSYNLEPRHRILLSGSPGNGKTSLAEAIADSLSIPLLTIRYDGLITSFLGETNQRLRQIFDYVRGTRSVLFFDEFDTVGKERGDEHETGEIKRVVSSLLLQIDALPSHVIVIAASNHPELLDRAVWRRFHIKLQLQNPSTNQIEKWFIMFQDHSKVDFDYNLKTLSRSLAGLCFSDIENFALNILRRYVLQKPDGNLRQIINQQLAILKDSRLKTNSKNAARK